MTIDKIPYKSFIMEYIGEIINSFETENRDSTYFFNIDEEFCGQCLFIDGKTFGNITRFANHCCEPNLDMHMAVIDSEELLPRLAFFANRNIKPYEELTYHYGRKTLTSNENGYYSNDSHDSHDSGISSGSDSDGNGRQRKRFKTQRNSTNVIKCLCNANKCKKII